MIALTPIVKITAGLILIFVASRLVGLIIKLIGIGFVAYGGFRYLTKNPAPKETIFPAVAGLALIFVGKSMAETVIRIVGLLVVIWGLLDFGII